MASNYLVGGTVLQLMREEMSNLARHVIEHDVDPVTQGIVLNTDRVETVGALGRRPGGDVTSSTEFQAIHPLQFGRSGTIQYAAMGTKLAQDVPPILQNTNAYPAITDVPQRTARWLVIPLKWIQGSLTIERRQWLALTAGNPVTDFLAEWLRDPIELIRQQLTTDFFEEGKGKVGVVGTTVTFASAPLQNSVILSTRVRPMWRGMDVRVYDQTSSSPNSTLRDGTFMVMAVHSYPDYSSTSNTKIELLRRTGTGSVDVESDDALILKGAWDGTTGNACQGLKNFLLDPGTASGTAITLHGLTVKDTSDVYAWPELLSVNDSPGTNRWPTPSVFELNMDRISDRGFEAPDRIVLSRGVRTLFYMTEGLYKTYNTELSNTVQRGADGGLTGNMAITSEKGVAEIVVSAFCPKNTAWGYRPDAFIRYAPKGTDAVQFVGENELVGGSMFLVGRSSDAPTPVYEAPFDFWTETGCVKPQCIMKVGNLYEHEDVD